MRIAYFYVPTTRNVPMPEKPLSVQTVIPQNPVISDGIPHDNPEMKPSFPRDTDSHWKPMHDQHVFYEDEVHDWAYGKDGVLRYYSRAYKDRVWIRCEFDDGYVNFGDVARQRCGMQAQYCSHYLEGKVVESTNGKVRIVTPKLTEGLRWRGSPADYHFVEIHKDDVNEFVKRVISHRTKIGAL